MYESVSEGCGAFQQDLFNRLGEEVRTLVTRLLNRLMGVEQMMFLGCVAHERTDRRRGWRNGYDPRWLDTRWGSLRLRIPKVRDASKPFRTRVIERYRRYQHRIEDAVRTWAAFGMSTRKVTRAVHAAFDCIVSAATVSRIIARLDEQIATFHRRSLDKGYRYLFLDAKRGYISKATGKRGRGKKESAVLLLAWGIDHGGREELVDFRVAPAEDGESWTAFVTDLEARGLKRRNRWDEKLEMIVSDDAGAIEAACEMVYPRVPRQLCAFHKVQNIAEHLQEPRHRKAILADAGSIHKGLQSIAQARLRLSTWAERWRELEPEAVRNFCAGFERTLRYLEAPPRWRRRLKTNNPIERLIRELNRKYSQMGVFPNATSWERATYLTWKHLRSGGYPHSTQNLFTRNS